jgi:hypothetical protein
MNIIDAAKKFRARAWQRALVVNDAEESPYAASGTLHRWMGLRNISETASGCTEFGVSICVLARLLATSTFSGECEELGLFPAKAGWLLVTGVLSRN